MYIGTPPVSAIGESPILPCKACYQPDPSYLILSNLTSLSHPAQQTSDIKPTVTGPEIESQHLKEIKQPLAGASYAYLEILYYAEYL